MPPKTQTKSSDKIEKLKQSNKLNKNILSTKTLEAFTIKAKLHPFRNINLKNMFKTIFLNRSALYLHDLKKIIGP